MIKRLVIFGNTYHRDDTAKVMSLLDYLQHRGLDIAVEREYLHHLCGDNASGIASFEADHVMDADMALSLGGDGIRIPGIRLKIPVHPVPVGLVLVIRPRNSLIHQSHLCPFTGKGQCCRRTDSLRIVRTRNQRHSIF